MIAPPWTPIPPLLYGGIELVVDQLARGLQDAGHEVLLFATGDSTCPVPRQWVLPAAEGTRIGMVVPEIRHVIHAYEAVQDCDVVHDHTMMGPFHSERYPGLPVATTIHGPFNEELSDIYRANAERVPIVAISHAQRRAAPDIPIARVIHHGVDAAHFPVGDGSGDEDGPYVLFLGRMAADKGAHRAIEVARRGRDPDPPRRQDARAVGDALLLRVGRTPPRDRCPLPGRGLPRAQAGVAGRSLGAPLPHPVERAVRHGDDRSAGLRHAGPGLPRGGRPRGRRRRAHRLPLR